MKEDNEESKLPVNLNHVLHLCFPIHENVGPRGRLAVRGHGRDLQHVSRHESRALSEPDQSQDMLLSFIQLH